MRIYLIRHADPDYPNKTITEAGHLEAKALAPRLRSEGINRIFVSPLRRAIHTMQYTADLLKLDYEVIDWVQEIGGFGVDREVFGTTVAWNITGEIMRSRPRFDQDNWHNQPPFDDPKFRGRYEELVQNSDAFFEDCGYCRKEGAYEIVSGNRDRIAVFCHAGFGMTWLAHILDLPVPLVWSGFFLAPSSVTTILFDERDDKIATPRALSIGDTSHLYSAGLKVQPAGIIANYD